MTKKKKYKESKAPSKKLYFERPYGLKLEDLLDIYMKVIGNINVELDMKLDKISITLSAPKSELEKTVYNLQNLQKQLVRATNPNENGYFEFTQELFSHLFKGQIQTKFLSQVVKLYDYHSEYTPEKSIISDISLEKLKRIQYLANDSLKQAPRDQNKDIQRFITLVNLKTNKPHDEILQLGLHNGLLVEKSGQLYFQGNKEKVMDQIVEIVNDPALSSSLAQDILEAKEPTTPKGFGLDGGKIVFVNASNDLQRSTYEDQDKHKEQ